MIPFILSLLSGLLLMLSFPRWEFQSLAWIALTPLFWAIKHQTTPKSFLLGWISGLAYFGGTVWWVMISMHYYGGLSWPISFLIMLLLVAYLALYVGLFTAILTWAGRMEAIWIAPFLWVSLEFIRGHLLTGFPWVSIGYSQYRLLPVIQIADMASVYGVSFLLVFANAAIYKMLLVMTQNGQWTRQWAWKTGICSLSVVMAVLGYGAFRLSQPMAGKASLTTAVIQGNIPQDKKWDKAFQAKTVEIYTRLSQAARGARPLDLIIWPEAATPFFFQTETPYQLELSHLAREGGFSLLFGSPAFEPVSGGRITLRNSAYLLSPKISPQTVEVSRYDKMHLVPFGEYVPLASLLFFVNKMVAGIGDFSPGEAAAVMEVAGTRIGTVICFEVIFPEVVRQFVVNGAKVMTTLTNDAWFGDSAAADQHFSMVVFRAVENRVPFARAANTGISGFIDAHGRILKQGPLFMEAALTETLSAGTRSTVYTEYGDWFPIGCGIITFILLILFGSSWK